MLGGVKINLKKQFRLSTHLGRKKKKSFFLNAEKTSAIWLDNGRNSSIRYMPHLQMEGNPLKFKTLGIWFTNDLKDCEVVNNRENCFRK